MNYKQLLQTVIQPIGLTVFLGLFVVPVTHAETLLVKTVGDGTGSVKSQPAGIDCGAQCTADYDSGTTVLLAATPADDSSFLGWEGDCNKGQVVMDDHKSCTAAFTLVPIYTLQVSKNGAGSGTVSSIPAGIDCGSDCLETYKNYTPIIVTLTPTADAGSRFTGWTGNCSGDGAEQVSMDKNQHCIATFESAGVLQLASETARQVNEEVQTVFTVSRTGGTAGEVSLDYSTTDGTAIADSDYQPSSDSLIWGEGDSEDKTITLTILPDKLTEEPETFSLSLSNPQGGALLGEAQQVELTIVDVSWLSSVQFAQPAYTVEESQGEVSLLVTRAGNSTWPLTVEYQTADRTANADSDYTPVSGTLTWGRGERQPQLITVPVREDSLTENAETFVVSLKVSDGAQLGANQPAIVTIVDTPTTSRVEFSVAEYSVNEDLGKIIIPVHRFGHSTEAIAVNYATGNSSAKAGEDYTATQGTLNWRVGDLESKYFTVPILFDDVEDGEETLTLMLTNPTNTRLGSIATAIVKIVEGTGGTLPSDYQGLLQLTASSYEVAEREGRLTMAVTRTNGNRGAVAVTYTTADDSAIAGQDYQKTQGELRWENGEAGEKRFSVGILDDSLREEEAKRFTVTLSTPSGGAALGGNTEAVITIQDDDTTILLLSSNTYEVPGNRAEATLIVTRDGSSLGQVSVDYTTHDETAIAGEDYTATVGQLIWLSGERFNQTVTIPIVFDRTIEGDETLQFRLSNPSRNAILGTPNEAVVTIKESDSTDCAETGQVIDCYLIQDDEAPPLQDIEISLHGTVEGGKLTGTIQNLGWVQDVTLGPNTHIIGGTVSGDIRGESAPATAILSNVDIVAGTTLSHVVIGSGSVIDSAVFNGGLGAGVRFEENSQVPEEIELGPLLGKTATAVLGQSAVTLTDDVLLNSTAGGILADINDSPPLEERGWVLTQDEGLGMLTLEIAEARYAVLPMQVKHIFIEPAEDSPPLSMKINNAGQIIFITHRGRAVTTHPVVQAPIALNEALRSLSLNEAEMLDSGNLKIPVAENTYFMVRADLQATQVPAETPLGITSTATGVSFVFEDSDGSRRQQFIYPAAADPEALYALSATNPETLLNLDGQVVIQIDGRKYPGRLDYLVTSGEPSTVGVQVQDIADVNGDSCNDYRIVYPNGDSQVMFCLLR